MKHWIITNREVRRQRADDGSMPERITDARREPLPTFRIASFTPPQTPSPSDEELAGAVEVVPDSFPDHYDDLRPNGDPEKLSGSSRLFLSLYQTMRDTADSADGGDTLFFIHGYNYSYPCALRDLLRLHHLYALPNASPIQTIVYFTWPSWGRRTRYPSDQAIAQPSGYLLGRIFAKAVHFHMDFFGTGAGREELPRT